jgi:hypothetical protein
MGVRNSPKKAAFMRFPPPLHGWIGASGRPIEPQEDTYQRWGRCFEAKEATLLSLRAVAIKCPAH